ncbi:MAG: hypothetical protein J6O89_01170 [Aeriscardovia sp.]|nr:hypothetical protein [Aeriscardovia sp.]
MKSTKTKKFLGGVAIAAVSLGCLGLAGIANAADTTTNTGTTSSTSTSGAYQLPTTPGAMTGSTTITANISTAQTTAGQKLTDHTLEYVQIGSYIAHGTSGSFTLSATNQTMEDDLYNFLTATSGGLKQAFPSASYTSADGEALNWLFTGNSSGTFLGADASGQAGYGTSENTDYAVRLLANYLYANMEPAGSTGSDLQKVKWNPGGTDQTGTFDLPNPGVYLIIDYSDSGNASLPIILSTKPSTGYTVPSTMTNYVTDTISLKDQDPQAAPVKQFVTDPSTNSSGDLTGGKLTGTMSATVGSQNTVTYQISNIFPNTNGYPSYTYKFIDNPGTGMDLDIAKGANMYVAGIPLTTLVGDGDATVTLTTATMGRLQSITTNYGSINGTTALSNMPILVGGTGAQMAVNLNEAGMQYIAAHGYQTSNVSGKNINFKALSSQDTVTNTVNGTTNTMSGVNKGASSYTGQTQAASSGENGNSASAEYPQAGGELFGLTYQAYLNQDVAYSGGTTEASNTAQTINNGTPSTTTTPVPLTTSGTYNGGTTTSSGKASGTTQTNPDQITGTDGHMGTTDGVPNIHAVGAGLTWMKIWGSGAVAAGASFYVQNSSKEWLYATGTGWGWTHNKADAQKFEASTPASGTNPAANGGLFEINGLANGTYTVTEVHAATGADQNVLPSFTVTVTADAPEEIHTSSASDNLVNNTPNGSPFNSTDYNTVENVKSLTGLPLTGGAGILTGVIAAVILFGTAGIVLVVYKRRKQQKD